MNRRGALAALGVILLPGCYRPHPGDVTATVPPGVDDLEFERMHWTRSTVDIEADPLVNVHFNRGIAVEGSLWIGSGSCNQAVLEAATVDGSMAEFVVGSGPSRDHPDHSLTRLGCTQGLAGEGYRLYAVVPEEVSRVTVVERDVALEDRATTVAFEVDYPPGSPAEAAEQMNDSTRE